MSSSFSCIISITRLLSHFNLTNGQKFQKLLMNELGCDNEAQLWCKILPSLSTLLTNQSLSKLKKETMIIAEQQLQPSTNKTICITNNDNTETETEKDIPVCKEICRSVYKAMQHRYKDPISSLHSDIIDYLGTYLDKKQSIEFGYLNKQLYIETQKQSYLLKRRNDAIFSINDFTADRFHWKETNPFAYSLPQNIHIGVKPYERFNRVNNLLQSSKWYKNIFYVLNKFTCQNFSYLANIPIDKLFSIQGHFKHNAYNARLPQIETFACMLRENYQYCDEKSLNATRIFCKNFENYYKNKCNNNANNIRNIKQLLIDKHYTHNGNDQGMRKKILLTLGKISKYIKINNSDISIDNIKELQQIFQANLKTFEFDSSSEIFFDESLDMSGVNNINNNIDDFDFEVSYVLKSLDLSARSFQMFMIHAKALNLDSKIKCYKISIGKRLRMAESSWRAIFAPIFNLIDIQRYDSNRSNNNNNSSNQNEVKVKEKIVVVKMTQCDPQLCHVFDIFAILHKYRSQVLDSVNNDVITVRLELHLVRQRVRAYIRGIYDIIDHSHTNHSADETKIKYQDCDLSKEHLDIIYYDTIRWFKNVQKQHGDEELYKCHSLELKLHKQVKINE